MSPHRSAIGAALVATCLVLAACGAATPPSSTGPGATPVVGERTPGPSGAPELAAMLPDSVGGLDFVKSSFTGEDVSDAAISLDQKALETLATGAGKTLHDVQVAEARPRDASKSGIVVAIRVPGADPKKVVDATFSKSKDLLLATMAGKTVYNIGGTGLGVVVYIKDDVMFQVVGAPKTLTEAIIAALP